MKAPTNFMDANPESSIDHVFLDQHEQGHLVHDMKSPFNGIVGLTEPMAKMSKEPEKKKQLTWINVSGARWCRYIEATVESAPLAAGQVDLKAENINLGFCVEEVFALMTVSRDPREQLLLKEGVQLVNTVPLEGLTVTGSDPHTAKCIYHLVMNALKFTDAGSITLSHRVDGESHVVILVTDTGLGIAPDQLEKCFDPFVKFSDRYAGESLGLGLSSTKEYIEFVGGKILLQSEVGKGTVAELWVPRTASNMGSHKTGPFGFGYYSKSVPVAGPWLLQKRALGMLAVDLLPAHFGIAGMAETLIANEPKPAAKKQLGMIQRSGNRVVEVLSLLRDSTLRSDPQVVPRCVPTVFASIAETVFAELNKALDKRGQPMKKKAVEFLNESAGSVPVIKSDPFYVYRIIYQLCDNALKFTAEGKVVVTASASACGGLQVVISDTGCGFDMGKLEEIFKPLHRLEPETYYGLGLGLNMVNDMAQKLGASLEYKSIKGKETVVTLIVGEGTAQGGEAGDEEKPTEVATSVIPPVETPVVPVAAPVVPVVVSEPPKIEPPVVAEAPKASEPAPVVESLVVEAPAVEVPKEVKADVPVPAPTIAEPEKPQVRFAPEPEPVVAAKASPVTVEAVAPQKLQQAVVPQEATPDSLQFVYADMPKEDEDVDMVKRKTLAGDKYRILVEMDDGSEPPSIQSALSNLSLAVEIIKERIAVANSTSGNIKDLIRKIEDKYY